MASYYLATLYIVTILQAQESHKSIKIQQNERGNYVIAEPYCCDLCKNEAVYFRTNGSICIYRCENHKPREKHENE